MVRIFLNSDVKVDFCLRSKVTLVIGNSGVGKTFLGRWLQAMSRYYTICTPKHYKCVYVNTIEAYRGVRDGTIVFLDEMEQWKKEEVFEAMNIFWSNFEKDIYYVVSHRTCTWLDIDGADRVKLVNKGGIYTFGGIK